MSLAMRAGAGSPLPRDADRWWRVAAEFSLAAADAIEDAAGMQIGTVGLKWPNDLVVRNVEGGVTRSFRKVGGLLAEAGDTGSDAAWLVVGLGLNVRGDVSKLDSALAATATSLEIATGRPIDREALFTDVVSRLEGRLGALADGRFDVASWRSRQLLDGCSVDLEVAAGEILSGLVVGHDGASGTVILSVDGTERAISAGEVTKVVRIATP
jgi:BirA family biotin operon repressor/biotin-[acetyl-CoA-carboxylase] ligase